MNGRGGTEVNTSPVMHKVVSLIPGTYQCVFFHTYALSKFILHITGIDEINYPKETWTGNQFKPETDNSSLANMVINALAFSE